MKTTNLKPILDEVAQWGRTEIIRYLETWCVQFDRNDFKKDMEKLKVAKSRHKSATSDVSKQKIIKIGGRKYQTNGTVENLKPGDEIEVNNFPRTVRAVHNINGEVLVRYAGQNELMSIPGEAKIFHSVKTKPSLQKRKERIDEFMSKTDRTNQIAEMEGRTPLTREEWMKKAEEAFPLSDYEPEETGFHPD